MKIVTLLIGLLLICTSETRANFFLEEIKLLESPRNFITDVKLYVSENIELSENCSKQLTQYVEDLKQFKEWALRMFDASAKIPSGILDGNFVEFGSFSECINIVENAIHGKYCLAEFSIDNPDEAIGLSKIDQLANLTLRLAVCFPSACTASEIQGLFNVTGINVKIGDGSCQTKDSQPKLDTGAIVVLCFLALVLWGTIASTLYDAIMQHIHKAPLHPLLISFSLLTNGRKLLANTKSLDEISCLHGIRVISTMWIILGHTYLTETRLPMKNFKFVADWYATPSNMFIVSAPLAVDTFLLLGGLTISYIFMTYSKRGVKFNLLTYYFHRYIRLTPALAVMILFHLFLIKYMGSGPLWPTAVHSLSVSSCEQGWWRALLYFQNYFNDSGPCLPHSWYLSVDMQLFILSPLLLLPLLRWPTGTLLVTGFLALCSMACCFAVTWIYNLSISFVSEHRFWEYDNYYYMTTHTRATPWLLGLILGYLIYITKRNGSKMVLNYVLVITFWIISLVTLSVCVFSGFDLVFAEDKTLESALYNTFIRPAWAVAVGWIVYACQFEYGGYINWFLSCRTFRMLSKLTYSLYLVHILIITITKLNLQTTPVHSNTTMLENIWVQFIMCLFASILLTLGFESPIISIEKLLFRKPADPKSNVLPTRTSKLILPDGNGNTPGTIKNLVQA